MNARLLTTATLATVMASVLPARAADPQLLNLVMPDATVVAGVNVEQAKTTPFGQYVLSLIQPNDPHLQELATLTGFDPTRDVREVLVASNGTPGQKQHSGLAMARGSFDPARILSAATAKGATTEVYSGVTIIEGNKQEGGIAFLDASTVVAGDLANVKAAIDRRSKASILPSGLSVQINQWSTTQDAWAVSMIPTALLHAPAGAPPIPGVGAGNAQSNAFNAIQQAAGGVKFGSMVVLSAQAQADTAQNAQTLGDTLKLLANLGQLQAGENAAVKSLATSLNVTTAGNLLNVSVSLPQDQLQNLVKPKVRTAPRKVERRM